MYWSLIGSTVEDGQFCGAVITVWEKHKFVKDKFLGIVTLKFNNALFDERLVVDDWFKLNKRKKKQKVTGDLHMRVLYIDPVQEEKLRNSKRKSSYKKETGLEDSLKISGLWNGILEFLTNDVRKE